MRISAILLTVIATVGLSLSANATLLVIDDDLVYDTSINLYFQRDWLAYTGQTYNEMRASVEDSTVGGITDWRLIGVHELFASTIWDYGHDRIDMHPTEFAAIFEPSQHNSSEFSNLDLWEGYTDLFEPSTFIGFGGEQADYDIETAFIAGTYSSAPDNDEYGWDTFHMQWHRTNEQLDSLPLYYGSWVVSSGPYPVPEPANILFFGTGLIGFAGFLKRVKK